MGLTPGWLTSYYIPNGQLASVARLIQEPVTIVFYEVYYSGLPSCLYFSWKGKFTLSPLTDLNVARVFPYTHHIFNRPFVPEWYCSEQWSLPNYPLWDFLVGQKGLRALVSHSSRSCSTDSLLLNPHTKWIGHMPAPKMELHLIPK